MSQEIDLNKTESEFSDTPWKYSLSRPG